MADGVKISSLPSATTPSDNDVIAGVQNGTTKKFSFSLIKSWLQSLFVTTSEVGVAGGVASLDSTGKVPGTQLDISGKQDTITASGILKGDGTGGVTAATPGTDYQAPLTAGTDYATPAQLADKADQSQLAYVETGATATKTGGYTAGEYIFWQGTLYTANTNIAYGTTLSAGTGGNLTECISGGLNLLNVFPSIKLAQTINVNVPDGGTNFVFSHTATKKENVYVSARTRFKGDNDSASTNGVYELAIRLNTDFVVSNQLPFVTRGYRSISASFMCQLQAGDTLAVRVFQTSGVALDVDGFVYFGAAS